MSFRNPTLDNVDQILQNNAANLTVQQLDDAANGEPQDPNDQQIHIPNLINVSDGKAIGEAEG